MLRDLWNILKGIWCSHNFRPKVEIVPAVDTTGKRFCTFRFTYEECSLCHKKRGMKVCMLRGRRDYRGGRSSSRIDKRRKDENEQNC